MVLESPIIKNAERYVRDFMSQYCTDKMCYHNIDHTYDVVRASEKIGAKCGLSSKELEIVILAAWFHDTGYYKGGEDHENESANIATDFLKENLKSEDFITKVIGCIKATKIPQNPQNKLEQVLCDADLYHLSTNKFFKNSELLRKEIVAHHCQMSPMSWMSMSCEFVSRHSYFTEFAKKILRPKKEANLKKLETKLARIKSKLDL